MRVILIDDEELALKYLEYQLLRHDNIEIIGKFTNPFQGAEVVKESTVDIVFLDIQMPEINGLLLAEELLEWDPSLNIVFTTAYEEYAIEAFKLNALDYLLKPVNSERLLNTLNRIKDEDISESKNNSHGSLRLNLFNKVHIINSKKETINLKWRTSKAEQFFLYLIQNRGLDVQRDKIVELFWPDIELSKSLQRLYTTIYQVRKTLANYSEYFPIESTTNGYILTLKDVRLDIEEFDELIQLNGKLDEGIINQYEEAIEIANGEYLEGYDYIWCEIERQRLLLLWMQTTGTVINWYYKNDEFDKAINLCFIVLNRYPFEEVIYFYMMKIFEKQNKNLEVHEYYNKLKITLSRELEEGPSEHIIKWYEEWKKSLVK